MTDLQRLILGALRAQGFDGLITEDCECSCGFSDFAHCGDGPFSDSCVPARALRAPAEGEDMINPKTGTIIFHDASPGELVFVYA